MSRVLMDVVCQSGVIWIKTDRTFPLTTKHTYCTYNIRQIIVRLDLKIHMLNKEH